MASASDQIVDELILSLSEATSDESTNRHTVLEDALPQDEALEPWLAEQESRYRVKLSDQDLGRCFSSWSVYDLARAITRLLMSRSATEKTAVMTEQQQRQRAHQRYMAMRGLHLQRSKAYRIIHMQTIRRKQKAYRRKVKRKQIRPQQRIGSAAGGYTFIPR